MAVTRTLDSRSKPNKAWNISLWVVQALLLLMFGMAGVLKTFMAPTAIVPIGIAWAADVPIWFLRLVGLFELAGALGMILPAATRIKPFLTPLAAAGFVTIQVLAIGFHASRGETSETIGMNIVFLSLSAFVLWGRAKKVPISPP